MNISNEHSISSVIQKLLKFVKPLG